MLGRELVTRRARGFSPLPVRLGFRAPDLLAVGAHLKNTVAVSRGENVFISQHIGDLETKESLDAFHRGVRDMLSMFAVTPVRVVSDLHPDYLSTGFAQSAGFPLVAVQHHHAHVASCMAENGLRGTRPRHLMGWDRVRDRRHDLGRRVPSDRRRIVRACRRVESGSLCREEKKPSGNPAGRPSGSSSRCSARRFSGGVTCIRSCHSQATPERAPHDARARGERAVHDKRREALRRRRVHRRDCSR
jgi:hypothetical protein